MISKWTGFVGCELLANNRSKMFRIGLLRLFASKAQIPITWRGFEDNVEGVNFAGEEGALIISVIIIIIVVVVVVVVIDWGLIYMQGWI